MRRQNRCTGMVVGVVLGVLLSASVVLAGTLEPSVGPTAAGSQMYTLDQIYDLINNGTIANKMATFTEPASGPTAGTMHTLDEVYALVGQRAPVPKTGQTLCFDSLGATVPCAGTGQDGALQKGVVWPNPRFTVSNGTVTDNLTGLIWLQNANCTDTAGGISKAVGILTWANALTWSNNLAGGNCGLTDGSTVGQWRLPNVKELQSLIDFAFSGPALSNTAGYGHWTQGNPFTGVQSGNYWSSSTLAVTPFAAWYVDLKEGTVRNVLKTFTTYVWPVRGGQ